MKQKSKLYKVTMSEDQWEGFIPTKSKGVTIEEVKEPTSQQIDMKRVNEVLFDLKRIVALLENVLSKNIGG